MKTVAEYRKFAEDSRELAAKLKTPDDKRALQLMAAAWDKVANEREAQLTAAARRFPLRTRLAAGVIFGALAAIAILTLFRGFVPIVFTLTPDPVGAGFVESLARPGGNATGFTLFEYSMGGKWLELLKEIAPGIRRAAVVRDPALSQGTGLFGAIQSAASSFGVELTPVNVRDASEIERALAAFARSRHGGLIVTASVLAVLHRDLLVTLAAQQKLPAVYFHRLFVAAGGLISYGPDFSEQYARAAGYVDRILKGEKPSDLPVQAPTKYELVINLKTANALGLTIPEPFLVRADEVIE
jgi:putative ABC transport system substrate-binding protein